MASLATRKRIAWRVRLLRMAQDWPRAVLAMHAGVAPLVVTAVEAGEPVDLLLLDRIARALGVLLTDFYDDSDWAVVKILHREGDADPSGPLAFIESDPDGGGP